MGPSILVGEPSWAELFAFKLSQTELSLFQNWTIFDSFSVDFFKEYNYAKPSFFAQKLEPKPSQAELCSDKTLMNRVMDFAAYK